MQRQVPYNLQLERVLINSFDNYRIDKIVKKFQSIAVDGRNLRNGQKKKNRVKKKFPGPNYMWSLNGWYKLDFAGI
jgi:hypothetical protein